MQNKTASTNVPATPGSSDSHPADTNVLSAGERLGRSEMVEPSPASTHGESEVVDSAPATPTGLEGPAITTRSVSNLTIRGSYDDIANEAGQARPASGKGGIVQRSPGASSASDSGANMRRLLHQSDAVPSGSNVTGGSDPQGPVAKFATQNDEGDPFFVGDQSKDARSFPDAQPFIARPAIFHPREDREFGEISGDNAQAVFAPSACVFVANLAATSTDEQLEHDVSRVFEQFGKVYTKIKRDGRGMPYAFCQYENENDAEKAISLGHGLLIQGRACRTERARVNRSLYLSRTSGGPIAESLARSILAKCGPLEKLWTSGPTDREMFRLPEGIWVTFAFFQDCRDAQAAFKDNPEYRLEQPSLPEDLRQRVDRTKLSPFAKSSPLRGRIASPMALSGNRQASCSVFVGNLPPDVSLSQLREHFTTCGEIRGIEIVAKANTHTSGHSVFAFVEFTSRVEARKAVAHEAPLDGRRLRVELRESHDHPFVRSSNFTSPGSPRNRASNGSTSLRGSSSLEAAMTRALALGIPAATTVQIFDPQSLEGSADNVPQTPLVTSIYPSLQYCGSPYSHYSPYGNGAGVPEASSADLSMYNPVNTAHIPVTQVPYGSMMNAHYGPGYQLPSYAYPTMTNEANNHLSGPSTFHDERAHNQGI